MMLGTKRAVFIMKKRTEGVYLPPITFVELDWLEKVDTKNVLIE
jgi:hypothetical protein